MKKFKEPKISFIMVNYTCNKEAFKSFMKGMISDYLNPDKMPKLQDNHLVGNVEIPQKNEINAGLFERVVVVLW